MRKNTLDCRCHVVAQHEPPRRRPATPGRTDQDGGDDRHQCTSLFVSRRTDHHQPTANSAGQVGEVDQGEPAVDVAQGEHPVDSTPCHSGVAIATLQPSGRLLTGKNAPENRNSGITPTR